MNLIWGNERVMMLCMLCMSASHENLHRELNTVTVMRFCRQTKTRRHNKEVAITARRITVRYKCRIFPYDCWVCTYVHFMYHRTLLVHIPISLWQIVPIWFLRNFWHLDRSPYWCGTLYRHSLIWAHLSFKGKSRKRNATGAVKAIN